jgi:Galactose binding lectin domain
MVSYADGGQRTEEFCQLETMHGRCRWKSEVMVVTSARWGRMKTGRCLNIHPNLLALTGHDPLFLGCSEDVLSLVDKKCSGRSECDIRIPDADLDKVTPCYPDQKCYLEVSYRCVSGMYLV